MAFFSYVRPKKAEAIKQIYSNGLTKRQELECYCFENATILPIKKVNGNDQLFGCGGVIADGRYVEASGIDKRVGGYYPYENAHKSEMKVVYCGYLVHHWGHFLIEAVARLWYVMDDLPEIDRFVFVVDADSSTKLTGNYAEFFRMLGILEKIEILNKPCEYQTVYVPELAYSRMHYFSDEYIRIFDKVINNSLLQSTKREINGRVFLSRSKLYKAKKTEPGLDMLDNYFSKNGFKILYPENLSLTDLVYYLQNANICAAESGTLPHNFLFAQQKKTCIIVERQAVINEIQLNIDVMKELSVTYIDSHYFIYPVFAGGGPFLLAYNHWLSDFSKSNDYLPPDDRYLSKFYIKKCLRQYMKSYVENYGYRWGLESWMTVYSDLLYEAYSDSLTQLGEYLDGNIIFDIRQLLRKQSLKNYLFNKRKQLQRIFR